MAVVVFCRYYYYPTTVDLSTFTSIAGGGGGGFAGVIEDITGIAKTFLRIAPFTPQKVVKNLPRCEISMGVPFATFDMGSGTLTVKEHLEGFFSLSKRQKRLGNLVSRPFLPLDTSVWTYIVCKERCSIPDIRARFLDCIVRERSAPILLLCLRMRQKGKTFFFAIQ